MKIDKGSFINDFIDKNLRQYLIPVYQRNYEWSAEQCEKLFEDILQAHKLDRDHFTGSVVYELLKTENKIDCYIIIDGQQRLTTIYILLKALADTADEADRDKVQGLLFNQDRFKKYDISDSSKLKLKPVASDNQQLMLLMENHAGRMDKASGIYKNYDLFCKLVSSALQNDPDLSIERIYDGIEHLTCAMIKLEDEERGKEQEIFERINSTGVPLNLADKIRNFVLMAEADQDRLYSDYWLPIEQMLSKKDMPLFFLDYINLKLDGATSEEKAYEDFKKVCSRNGYTNEDVLKELLHYARQYKTFLAGSEELDAEANSALKVLRRLKQTTVYLFLFKVFDDFENGVIDSETLVRVLQLLLRYSIRRLICEVSSSSLSGFYKTLYSRIFNSEENKKQYYDAIVSFLTQLTSKDVIPTDDEFLFSLRENKIYKRNRYLCKFLLFAVENTGKEKLDEGSLSIEHIMPQTKKLSKSWQNMLGENWKEVNERYLHTLGNLTLTGYNSELSSKPFEEKKKLLENTDTHITILNRSVLSQDAWTEVEIKARAEELSEKILKLFPIEEPETRIEFTDNRYQEYSASFPQYATNKLPNYYELLGERENVDTFAVMVRSVAAKLYERDPGIIEGLAKDDSRSLLASLFSYDEKAVRNPLELKKGSGIYIRRGGFSASECIRIIRELLLCYELNIEEDFVYSARPIKYTSRKQ